MSEQYSEERIEIDLGDLTPAADAPEDFAGELNLDFADFDRQDASDAGADLGEIDLGQADADEAAQATQIDLSIADDEAVEQPEDEQPQSDDVDEALEKALDELRTELRTKPGDWYVVHTYSGMENRVKQNIEARVTTLNMEDYIYEIVVPTEDAVEIRNGQKKTVTRTFMPGYVLVRMDLTDDSWATVRHTPSVTGIVGQNNQPVPLNLDEVERMLTPRIQAQITAAGQVKPKRQRKIEVADYQVGDSVMVSDGPFAGVHATITEINPHNQRVRANVEILGRETPVDLTFAQIQKVV